MNPRIAPSYAGLRVLIVEDSFIHQSLAARLLEMLGCTVDVVPDGNDAVEAVTKHHYDVVFMDCRMPGLDGFSATRVIRSKEQRFDNLVHLPIIALTTLTSSADRDRCYKAGMDGFISKPLRLESLQMCLERWTPQALAA